MNGSIEQNEKHLYQVESQEIHARKLLEALAPDPREWTYNGEVEDAEGPVAECACGHRIRWCFIIHRERDGRVAQVGSVCVNHFAVIAPELCVSLTAAVEKLKADIAADKKKAKEAREMEKVVEAEDKFLVAIERAVEKYNSYRENGMKAPRKLWDAVESHWYRYQRGPEGCGHAAR